MVASSMARLVVPETPEDLTPEWLTAGLTESGTLTGERVVAARWERVGQEYGFTGVVGRILLRYDPERRDLPASLVAKLPMAQGERVSGYRALQERDPDLLERYYERCAREERFYREIAVSFAPRLYYSAVDDARRRVVLLLEDVSGGRQGDDLVGCSLDDAALVIEELAPFHALWWGKRAPARRFPRSGGDPRERQERFAQRAEPFLGRYGDSLPPAICSIVDRLRSRLSDVAEAMYSRPQTLIHGDLHLDNMIFDTRSADRSVVVLDWQTVSVGPPAWDVALFLIGSLSVEDRRAAEGELLARYVELLGTYGVRGYSVEDLRRECGLALLVLLAGTVGWLTTLNRDELIGRERALHEAALADGRLSAALLDHDVEALLAPVTP
jgi:hypothetical protein